MAELVNDVVVVVPGIMGSTLARQEHDRQVPIWSLAPGGIRQALRTLGGSIRSLELREDVGDGPAGDGVVATGLMRGMHQIPGLWSPCRGYAPLLQQLDGLFELTHQRPGADAPPANLIPFAYDWRLSNKQSAQRLKATVEPVLDRWRTTQPDAKLVFICHSMGGLVARWYAEQLGGAGHTRKIITIGTPHRGSVNALETLANGMRKGFGPFAIKLDAMVRSFPSMYELLPAYRCVGGPQEAAELLAPHEVAVPNVATERVVRARLDFHDRLRADPTPARDGYELHTVVGTRQPTWATAQISAGAIVPSTLIDGDDLGGDGTVSRLAGVPPGVALDRNTIVGISEQHGTLQHHAAVIEQLFTALTGTRRVYQDGGAAMPAIGLSLDAVQLPGEPIRVSAISDSDDLRLRATLTDEDGLRITSELLWRSAPGVYAAELPAAPPGGYELRVAADGPTANPASPVTACTLVWDPASELQGAC